MLAVDFVLFILLCVCGGGGVRHCWVSYIHPQASVIVMLWNLLQFSSLQKANKVVNVSRMMHRYFCFESRAVSFFALGYISNHKTEYGCRQCRGVCSLS